MTSPAHDATVTRPEPTIDPDRPVRLTVAGDTHTDLTEPAAAHLAGQLLGAFRDCHTGHTWINDQPYMSPIMIKRCEYCGRVDGIQLAHQIRKLHEQAQQETVDAWAERDQLWARLMAVLAIADEIAGGPRHQSLIANKIRAALSPSAD